MVNKIVQNSSEKMNRISEKWIFVKDLPMNAVGKIDRNKLHEISNR